MNAPRGNAGTAITTIKPQGGTALPIGDLMERIIAAGDISALSPGDRAHYLVRVAESAGLNPLSQPFDLIPGQGGKMVLYANKKATDQLRKIYCLNSRIIGKETIGGVFVVETEVTDGRRAETNVGAVPIENLKGEGLANAIMKTYTKSKRRATLDWCGLGILDETEIEGLQAAARERRHDPVVVAREVVADAAPALGDGIPDGVTREVVDDETGEITSPDSETKVTVLVDITRYTRALGWTDADALNYAVEQKIAMRNRTGLIALRDALKSLVDTVSSDEDANETEDGDWGPEQGPLIAAESRPAGEPGLDRHSA